MTIAFRAAGAVYESGGASNIACALPSGLTDGDFCIALLAHGGSAAPTTVPTGWTYLAHVTLGGSYFWAVYYTVADGLSGNQQWAWAAGGIAWGVILAYSGDYDTADPIMASSNADYQTANTTLRCGGVTLSEAADAIYAGITYTGGSLTHTAPSTWTEDFDAGGASVLCFGTAGHKALSSGATGDVDATISATCSYKPGWLIALNPSSSGTSATVTVTAGSATASGEPATVTGTTVASATVTCSPGSAAASGTACAATGTANATVTCSPDTATASGASCTITGIASAAVTCAAGSATASGASLTITGEIPATVTITSASATTGGGECTVTGGTGAAVTLTAGSATAGGISVTIGFTMNPTVTITAGSATAGGALVYPVAIMWTEASAATTTWTAITTATSTWTSPSAASSVWTERGPRL